MLVLYNLTYRRKLPNIMLENGLRAIDSFGIAAGHVVVSSLDKIFVVNLDEAVAAVGRKEVASNGHILTAGSYSIPYHVIDSRGLVTNTIVHQPTTRDEDSRMILVVGFGKDCMVMSFKS